MLLDHCSCIGIVAFLLRTARLMKLTRLLTGKYYQKVQEENKSWQAGNQDSPPPPGRNPTDFDEKIEKTVQIASKPH